MHTFTDSGRVVASHQHPAFDRVLTQGYSLEFRYEGGDSVARTLVVRARLGITEVASASFLHRRGGGGLFRTSVQVAHGHTRRGLSTALHLLAEAVTGTTLTDYWGDDDQTDKDSLWQPTPLPDDL